MGHAVKASTPLTEAEKSTVEQNLGLAYYAAGKLTKTQPRIPSDEALSVAFLALIRAVQTYRDGMGARFSSWFFWELRAAVSRYYRSTSPAGYKRSDGRIPPKTYSVRPDTVGRLVNDRYHWSA